MISRDGRCLHCDVLGIGFGPANIALAIAAEEERLGLDLRFIESRSGPAWQPGMLLSGSDIQNNPLRDLVTLRNPRSEYTFVNYLSEAGRLLEYLNVGLAYPLRAEYSRYVQWAASHFAALVDYDACALDVRIEPTRRRWRVVTAKGDISASAIIVGTGRSPNIPKALRPHLGARVFHLIDYLPSIEALQQLGGLRSVLVLGGSQSAVEVHLDLLSRFPELEIHAVHRAFSMRQKDTSPFSDHVYFPEFVDYYYSASPRHREELYRDLRSTNYSAADIDVLRSLYTRIYEERLQGKNRFHLHNNTEILSLAARAESFDVDIRQRVIETTKTVNVDAIILATGFLDLGLGDGKEICPPVLRSAEEELLCGRDALLVRRDFRIEAPGSPPVFLNGLCESSHGFGDAGSFSLISLRASDIVKTLRTVVTPGYEEELGFRNSALANP